MVGDEVRDRVQQVRLAEARVPVDEERVVGLRRRLGDRQRGSVREPVRRADHERVERVLRVDPGDVGAQRVTSTGSGRTALGTALGAIGRRRRGAVSTTRS